MQRMACRVCSFCLGLVGAAFSAQLAAAAGIATVTIVTNEGYRTPPGANELRASESDELVSDEALRTGAESAMQLKFVDGSELSVESLSEVTLSDYVFDPQAAMSTGIIDLNVGLFRFNSADLPDSGLQLKTPVATIGIRGTEFLVTVTKERTIVDIVEGKVEVAPMGKGKAIVCEGGQSILVAGADSDAICDDFGAFTTAAGEAPSEGRGGGPNGEPREKAVAEARARPEPAAAPANSPPDTDPPDTDPPDTDPPDTDPPGDGDHCGHARGGQDRGK